MRSTAIDKVDLFNSALEGFQSGGDFWDHPTGDDPVVDKLLRFCTADRFNESGVVGWVAKQARNVGKVYQFGWFEGAGKGCCGQIRVDVVGFSGFFVLSERGNDRNQSSTDGVEDVLNVAGGGLADPSDINRGSGVVFAEKLFGCKN